MGGHSGMEISCERANANKIFGRFLAECMDEIGFSIVSVSGGEKDNAIAKQCVARLVVPEEKTASSFLLSAIKISQSHAKNCHDSEWYTFMCLLFCFFLHRRQAKNNGQQYCCKCHPAC